jgi:hypothetical protein
MAIVTVSSSTSTQVLAKGKRKRVILSNRGSNTIWFNYDGAGAVNTGFPLDQGQNIVLEKQPNDISSDLEENDLYALAETANTDVSVTELN